jgi:hypothetical protein
LKLPNAHLAIVERQKVVEYLLNASHPDNGGKAQFFGRLGFVPATWETLRDALLEIAEKFQVAEVEESRHGRKFVVIGELHGPVGKGEVRSVWIIDQGTDRPRLVTAYPER